MSCNMSQVIVMIVVLVVVLLVIVEDVIVDVVVLVPFVPSSFACLRCRLVRFVSAVT